MSNVRLVVQHAVRNMTLHLMFSLNNGNNNSNQFEKRYARHKQKKKIRDRSQRVLSIVAHLRHNNMTYALKIPSSQAAVQHKSAVLSKKPIRLTHTLVKANLESIGKLAASASAAALLLVRAAAIWRGKTRARLHRASRSLNLTLYAGIACTCSAGPQPV